MRFEEDGGARWDLPHRATASRDVALLTPVLTAETIGTAYSRGSTSLVNSLNSGNPEDTLQEFGYGNDP
jgi:hypothetical protein